MVLHVMIFTLILANVWLSDKVQYQSKAVSNGLEKVSATSAIIKLQKNPILIINLQIDRIKKRISVKSIKKDIGSTPDYSGQGLDFLTVETVNSTGKKNLKLIPVSVSEDVGNTSIKLNTFNQTIILLYDKSSRIKISKMFDGNQKFSSSIDLSLPNNLTLQSETLTPPIIQNYQLETIFDGDPAQTDPTKTLDIVLVSSGFGPGEPDLFRSFVSVQADRMIGFLNYPGKSPFSENKKVIKVRSLVSTESFHQVVDGKLTVDYDRVVNMLSKSGVPFDQYMVVLNADGTSGASLGGGYGYLYRTRDGMVDQGMLLAHEFAHSFGAILDEYVTSDSTGLAYLGRNCKEDPTEKWIHDEAGGSYIGCQYGSNLYRPEYSSIMNNLYGNIDYNAPTKYLLAQALSAYVANSIAPLAWPNSFHFYSEVSDNNGPWPIAPWLEQVWITSLGNKTTSYHAYFSPSVPWITQTINMDGATPRSISFSIDSQQLKTKGVYNTTLIIEIAGVTEHVNVPITIAAGMRNESNRLTLVEPTGSLSLNSGDSINVQAQQSNSLPGFRRIEYRFQDPYSNTAIFWSRTVSPYDGVFNTVRGDGSFINYGTYTLFAKGIGYEQGRDVISNSLEVEVVAKSGTVCSDYPNIYQRSFACSQNQKSRLCFKGANDCQTQNISYCCPIINLTPTPILVSPTPTSVSGLRGDANLDNTINIFDVQKIIAHLNNSIIGGQAYVNAAAAWAPYDQITSDDVYAVAYCATHETQSDCYQGFVVPTPTLSPTPLPPSPTTLSPTPLPPSPTTQISACQQVSNLIQTSYGSKCGQNSYQVIADMNKDQTISAVDFSLLSLVLSKPNSEQYCGGILSNSTNICQWAKSCGVLYGKIYQSTNTSCSQPISDYRKYDQVADMNKDGKIDFTDYNLFLNLANKTIDSTCQSYLSNTNNPCKLSNNIQNSAF